MIKPRFISWTLISSRLSVSHIHCVDPRLASTRVESVRGSPRDVADGGAFLASSLADPNNGFGIPTMAEIGLPPATTHIRGGETEGRRRMADWLLVEGRAVTSSRPKSSPTSLGASTSLLSPCFKFGWVSVRELHWRTQDITTAWRGGQAVTPGPANMLRQVGYASWRIPVLPSH